MARLSAANLQLSAANAKLRRDIVTSVQLAVERERNGAAEVQHQLRNRLREVTANRDAWQQYAESLGQQQSVRYVSRRRVIFE